MFQKATRQQSKLRLCISGPSGAGKTTGALTLAEAIKADGRIAVIDTENGSASLYADKYDFDVLNMQPPYNPSAFVKAIESAEQAGYTVIIVDSATHEWEGAGGCLEMNEKTAQTKFKGNTWSAWSETTKEHQKFINAIVHSSAHIICTARSKTETAQEGKRIMRLGTKLVQRDNFEYEFTVALDLVHSGHYATALKDRTGLFVGTEEPITKETGGKLLDWLNNGKSQKEIFDSHLKDVKDAQNMQELQDAYSAGYQSIKGFGDVDMVADFVKAKDDRKAKLQGEANETVSNN